MAGISKQGPTQICIFVGIMMVPLYNSQSNRKAESAMKMFKWLMKRSADLHIYWALLEWRNTQGLQAMKEAVFMENKRSCSQWLGVSWTPKSKHKCRRRKWKSNRKWYNRLEEERKDYYHHWMPTCIITPDMHSFKTDKKRGACVCGSIVWLVIHVRTQ